MYLKRGFSLVEMMIVLVVIGIVISAILVGKNLVNTAELQSVAIENQDFAAATQKFKEKYNYFPGDMPNASNFWDIDDHNGDGNGLVEASELGTSPITKESQLFWEHLSKSGYIDGDYDGTILPTAGVNVPALSSTVVSNGYVVVDAYTYPGLNYSDINYALALTDLTSYDSYYFDEKFDDALPNTGEYRAVGPCCGTSSDRTLNQYDLSSPDIYECTTNWTPAMAENKKNVASTSCFDAGVDPCDTDASSSSSCVGYCATATGTADYANCSTQYCAATPDSNCADYCTSVGHADAGCPFYCTSGLGIADYDACPAPYCAATPGGNSGCSGFCTAVSDEDPTCDDYCSTTAGLADDVTCPDDAPKTPDYCTSVSDEDPGCPDYCTTAMGIADYTNCPTEFCAATPEGNAGCLDYCTSVSDEDPICPDYCTTGTGEADAVNCPAEYCVLNPTDWPAGCCSQGTDANVDGIDDCSGGCGDYTALGDGINCNGVDNCNGEDVPFACWWWGCLPVGDDQNNDCLDDCNNADVCPPECWEVDPTTCDGCTTCTCPDPTTCTCTDCTCNDTCPDPCVANDTCPDPCVANDTCGCTTTACSPS